MQKTFSTACFLSLACLFVFLSTASAQLAATPAATPAANLAITPAATPTAQPGDQRTAVISGVKFVFRWCPPGTFTMGSPESEQGRGDNETQTPITFDKGFWMQETEVTQLQWRTIMGGNPSRFVSETPLIEFLPVEQVSWDECQLFCKALTQRLTNKNNPTAWRVTAKLPTEAQWEYACRAGSVSAFSWGNELNGDRANCDGRFPYGNAAPGKNRQKTTAVRVYAPNQWGLYDMHGNVWEWCQDQYEQNNFAKAAKAVEEKETSGSIRVVRGGCWKYYAGLCRSASRGGNIQNRRDGAIGFRCCLIEQEPVPEPDLQLDGDLGNSDPADGGLDKSDSADGGLDKSDSADDGLDKSDSMDGGLDKTDSSDNGLDKTDSADGGLDKSDSADGGLENSDSPDDGLDKSDSADGGLENSDSPDDGLDKSDSKDGGLWDDDLTL